MSEEYKPFIKLKNASGSETIYYSVFYEGCPEEFQQLVAKKLNESEDLRNRCLQYLRDYSERQNIKLLEDHVLLAFLRMYRYNLEKTEEKLKNFLNKRQEVIEMLKELDTDKIEAMIDDLFFGVFPYRDKNGCAIAYNRNPENDLNLERYGSRDIGVMMMVFALFLLKYPMSTLAGFSYFGDCTGLSLYILQIVKEFKDFLFIILSFPIRISRIEIFNESYLCRLITQIATPFIDSKILEKVYWHGPDFENLQEFYDLNIVPEEFGGNLGPLSNTVIRQKLLDFVEDLKHESISWNTT